MKLSYRSFAAGEVSRRLGARVDQVKYQTGAFIMRNMVSTLEGAVQNRSGTGFVVPCHNFTAATPPRLFPFVFSDSEAYVIILQGSRLSVINSASPQFLSVVNISAISLGDPCIVTTSAAHGLTTGDRVWIDSIVGTTQLNQRFFRAVVASATTFEIEEESGANIDSTSFTAWSSGGTVQEVYSISAPWDGADLPAIRYAQSADVMFFAHVDYPFYKLERTAGPVWTLTAVTFEPEIQGPTNGSGSGDTAGSEDFRYRVTSIDEDTLEESYRGIDAAVSVTGISGAGPDPSVAITGATNANPVVITSVAHGGSNGDFILVAAVGGMTQINGRYFKAANVTANTFELTDEDGANVDGTAYGVYTAGGTASRYHRYLITTGVAHNLVDDDEVILTGSVQFTELNATPFTIDVITGTTFRANKKYASSTSAEVLTGSVSRTSIYIPSITAPSAASLVTLDWSPVSGALEYNVYRQVNGIYGYVGTSATAGFIDRGYDVDPFDTPPIDRDVFSVTGDYPAAVGLFQQRLLLGGSNNQVERIDAGRTGLFYNFSKSNPIQADDSFSWVMRSNKVQSIRHILEMSRCMVFTDSSIWTLEGNESGSLVPTAVNPRKRAEHGLGDLAPMAIGNAVLYVQAFGKIVREILPGSGDDFNAKDITVYSRHLFDRNSVIAWAYAEEPASIVWAARDDGTMLGLTYLREHEIWGWHRHDTGAGDQVVDLCSIPEGEETVVYAVVRRFGVGGGDRYYIERMAGRQIAHQADGRFLDSYRYQEDENEDSGDTYSLDWDSVEERWTLDATGTTTAWVIGDDSVDINRVILLYGSDGQRYWCTILSINSTAQAFVSVRTDVSGAYDDETGIYSGAIDSDGAPTAEFPDALPYETSTWSQSIAEVTNLWHLEGRGVRVVADGYPQGPFIVTDGTVTLGQPAVQVVSGFQIIADLVTLEPDNINGETWTGKVKTVSEIDLRVEETDGVRVGTSWSTLERWNPDKRLNRPLPAEGQPYSGVYRANCGGARSLTGRVYIRQSDGLPTTILGVYPTMELAR